MLPTAPYRIAVCGAWLAFLWATTRWYSWQETIDEIFGSDMEEYERVALAAPGFPDETLLAQHANRFVPHYLIGLVSEGTSLGVRTVYYVAAFALLLGLLFAVDRIAARFRLGTLEYALCIGALVANPYVYRFLAICPARLSDSLFMVGGLLALVGLLRVNPWLLVGGLVAAVLARSEASVVLVLLAPVGVALAPAWRARSRRWRWIVAGAAIGAPVVAYSIVLRASERFAESDYPGFWRLTVFGTLRELPGTADTLGTHGARVVVGVAAAGGVLLGLLALRRFAGAEPLSFVFWAALAAGAGVSGEALLLNPDWIRGNQPLLAALGTAFLAVAAAAAAGTLRTRIAWQPGAAALAGLALVSLNHRYSSISPVQTPGRYAALAVIGAAVTAAAIALAPRFRHRGSESKKEAPALGGGSGPGDPTDPSAEGAAGA